MEQISVQQYIDSFGGYDKFFDENIRRYAVGYDLKFAFISRAVDLALSGNREQGLQILRNLLQDDYWLKMNEYARKKGYKFYRLENLYKKMINSNLSNDEEFLLELNKLDNDVTDKFEGNKKDYFSNYPFTVFDVASDELKNNKDFVLECIKTNYRVLGQITNTEWLNDYDFMHRAISIQPLAYKYLKDTELFKSKELQLLAVSKDPNVINIIKLYMSNNHMIIDDDVVMTAVKCKNSSYSVRWKENIYESDVVSDKIKKNPEFLLYASSKDTEMFHLIPDILQNNEEFKSRLFELNPARRIMYAKTKDERFALRLKYDLDMAHVVFNRIDDKFNDDLKLKFITLLQEYKKKNLSIYSLIERYHNQIKDDKDIAFAVLKNGGYFTTIEQYFPSIYSQIFEDKKLWLEAIKYDDYFFTKQRSFWDKETILYYLNNVSKEYFNIRDFNDYLSDPDIRALIVKKFTYEAMSYGILNSDEIISYFKNNAISSINPEKEISEYTYKFSINENTALPEVEERKFCPNDSIRQEIFSVFPFIKDLYDEHDKIYDSVIELCRLSIVEMKKMLSLSDYDNDFIFKLINTNSLYWFYLPYEIQIMPAVKDAVINANPEMQKYISRYDFKRTL